MREVLIGLALIVVFSLLSSCMYFATPPVQWHGIDIYPESHRDQDKAMLLTLDRMEDYFRQSFWDVYPNIYWTFSRCEGVDTALPCIEYMGMHLAGITFSEESIWVAYRDRVSLSALVHELAHLYKLKAHLDGDAAHEDKVLWEQVVPMINAELYTRGL